MSAKGSYKPIPNGGGHRCFGCSRANPAGLQMQFFTDEKTVVSWLTVPEHLCGWSNLVHGGVVSTILDEIMSWAAIYLLKKIILTKSMTIDFLKPVFVGNKIKAEGHVLEQASDREALMMGSIYGARGELCATSRGTFALLTPKVVRKLGIMDEKALKDFEAVINPEPGFSG